MKMDLKQQLKQRPFAGLAASIGAGLILGLVWRGGRDEADEDEHPYRELYQAEQEAEVARLGPKSEAQEEPGMAARITDTFSDEIDLFKTAVVTAAIGIARGWIREQLPDVGNEMDRMRGERRREHADRPREHRGNGRERVAA